MSIDVHAETARPSATEHYVSRLLRTLNVNTDRAVLHWRDTIVTAGELRAWILATAEGLRNREIGAGDTVALLTASNHPGMLAIRYAANLLGAAVLCVRSVNPRTDDLLAADTQATMLQDASARMVVVDETGLERAHGLRASLPGLSVVGFRIAADGIDDVCDRAGSRDIARGEGIAQAAGDLAVIAFTSGTTGQPKGIRQPLRTWHSLVDRFDASTDEAEPPRVLAVTPVSGTIGCMLDAVLIAGGSVVLHETFDLDAAVQALHTERITDIYLAVPHLYALVERAGAEPVNAASLRRLIYSGTPAAAHRIADAVRVFGPILYQLYGSTEAGGISSLTPLDHYEPELHHTVGKPFAWVDVRVRHPETGMDLPAGHTGEIWVSSPTVMAGYLGDAALTRRVLRDGWLRTGDLGYRDQYGYLRLVDRVANVVKAGGLKLYPAAVEEALLRHPAVTDAIAFGVSDADDVESMHAAVAVRAPAADLPEKLRRHVIDALAPGYAPEAITVWSVLPRTPAGKPDRSSLRAHPRHRPVRHSTAAAATHPEGAP